ncbi:MAG: hypothetical protein JWN76_2726 [Chitinophagaceae bacterium]|nr:hypothetical protein [Chitinophagaceae bacterium]
MKVINTKIHGVLDYLYAFIIIAVPFVVEFRDNEPASYTCYTIGTIVLISSICTQYELGLIKVIPMRIHLILDVLAGIFVLASPWIFGFADRVYLPHVILGLTDLVVVSLSQPSPKYKRVLRNNKIMQHA